MCATKELYVGLIIFSPEGSAVMSLEGGAEQSVLDEAFLRFVSIPGKGSQSIIHENKNGLPYNPE